MITLKHILVPTDFSETSEAAAKYGVALARAFNATSICFTSSRGAIFKSWRGTFFATVPTRKKSACEPIAQRPFTR